MLGARDLPWTQQGCAGPCCTRRGWCVYRSSPSDSLLSPEKRDPEDGMEKQASSWARTLGQLFSFLYQEPPRRDEKVEAWRLVE